MGVPTPGSRNHQGEAREAEGVPPQRRYSADQIYREVEEDRGRKDKDTLEKIALELNENETQHIIMHGIQLMQSEEGNS